jgi:hypothetical protein
LKLRPPNKIVGDYHPKSLKTLDETVSFILKNQNEYLWNFSDKVYLFSGWY